MQSSALILLLFTFSYPLYADNATHAEDSMRAAASAPQSRAMELFFRDVVRQAEMALADTKRAVHEKREAVKLEWAELQIMSDLMKKTAPLISVAKEDFEKRQQQFSRNMLTLETGPDEIEIAKARLKNAEITLQALLNPKPIEQDPAMARSYENIWKRSWRMAVFKAEQADREYGFARTFYQRALRLKPGIAHVARAEEIALETNANQALLLLKNARANATETYKQWKDAEKSAIDFENRFKLGRPDVIDKDRNQDSLFLTIQNEWPSTLPKITDAVEPRKRDEGVEVRKDRLLQETSGL